MLNEPRDPTKNIVTFKGGMQGSCGSSTSTNLIKTKLIMHVFIYSRRQSGMYIVKSNVKHAIYMYVTRENKHHRPNIDRKILV